MLVKILQLQSAITKCTINENYRSTNCIRSLVNKKQESLIFYNR